MASGGTPLADGPYGPLLRGGRYRPGGPNWRRIGVLAVVLLAVLALSTSVALTGVLWYGSQQVGRVEVADLQRAGDSDGDGSVDLPELTDVLNILVVGSDSRERLSEEDLAVLGTEREGGSRTDTIMLVQLDPRRDQASVLSFPRDLRVTRCDGSEGKINAAYAIGESTAGGGPTCLVRTVTELTGIPINHFVQVDFAGFIEIVDALGGVSLYLEEPLVDAYAGLDLPAGCVELDGRAALGFVRTRRLDSDFGRIARQQRFIREVVAEASRVGTLVNVPKLLSLVDAAGKAVDADRDLSLAQMRRIALSLRDMDAEGLDMRTVPGAARKVDGVWYVLADEAAAEQLFAAFREARPAPGDLGTGEPTEQPTAVRVADVPPLVVLNGAGVAGLAGRAAEALDEHGFTVEEVGNASDYDQVRTKVTHPPALAEEAALVGQALGGAEVVEGGAGEDLTVLLGSDYEPDAPEVAEPAAPEATVAATPEPEPAPTPDFVGATPSEVRC